MSDENTRRDVFKEIYGVNRFSDIVDLFEEDYNSCKNKGLAKIQDLYKRYSYSIFFMYSPSSIRNNLVKFKNVIKKNGGKYQTNAIETFTIDSVYAPIKARDEEIKKDKKEKVKAGENIKIDPKVIIDQIAKFKLELEDRT